MKFDDQLAAYLYQTKTLRLEGIGTFTFDGKASIPNSNERDVFYPSDGIEFTYNPKSNTDEDLITFLVQKLHKIKPLIRSDLESYLSIITQFINLGKPYTIEGIGTLSKNNQGTFEFTPGSFLPAKEELHPKRENAEHNYPVRSQFSAGKVFAIILIAVAALSVLGGIGWGITRLISQNSAASEEVEYERVIDTLPEQKTTDTVTTATPPVLQKDSLPNSDSARYKMIFETTTFRARAIKRTEQLNNLRSYTTIDSTPLGDGMRYRLYLPMTFSNADTSRLRHIKDSLRIFFGGKIVAEKQ